MKWCREQEQRGGTMREKKLNKFVLGCSASNVKLNIFPKMNSDNNQSVLEFYIGHPVIVICPNVSPLVQKSLTNPV